MQCSSGRGIKAEIIFEPMILSELTPEALATAYLNRREPIVLLDGKHDPLWLWEAWISDDPEKAWQVFKLLLNHNNNDDALEQIVYRIHQLLANHWEEFHERVKAMVRDHKELPRFISESAIVKEQYTPRTHTDEEIVNAYLEHHRHSDAMNTIESLIANDPVQALPIVLEIINRGQDYGFSSFDLLSPLQDLLRKNGAVVIAQIEQEAKSSVMLRRCLWRMKRHEENTEPKYRINEQVWQRALDAAGATNDYNSELPETVVQNRLAGDGEELVSSWFAYHQTSWGFDEVWRSLGKDPHRFWEMIKAMTIAAQDETALAYIGAGPIEDFLSAYGDMFIDVIEQFAAINANFRYALTCVWKSDMSDELWQRVTNALGDQERYPN